MPKFQCISIQHFKELVGEFYILSRKGGEISQCDKGRIESFIDAQKEVDCILDDVLEFRIDRVIKNFEDDRLSLPRSSDIISLEVSLNNPLEGLGLAFGSSALEVETVMSVFACDRGVLVAEGSNTKRNNLLLSFDLSNQNIRFFKLDEEVLANSSLKTADNISSIDGRRVPNRAKEILARNYCRLSLKNNPTPRQISWDSNYPLLYMLVIERMRDAVSSKEKILYQIKNREGDTPIIPEEKEAAYLKKAVEFFESMVVCNGFDVIRKQLDNIVAEYQVKQEKQRDLEDNNLVKTETDQAVADHLATQTIFKIL
jgi:hypothetical protein